nr:protein RKD2-like [Ipomoea batatas]
MKGKKKNFYHKKEIPKGKCRQRRILDKVNPSEVLKIDKEYSIVEELLEKFGIYNQEEMDTCEQGIFYQGEAGERTFAALDPLGEEHAPKLVVFSPTSAYFLILLHCFDSLLFNPSNQMTNHASSSFHSQFIYCSEFDDTSIWDEINLTPLYDFENEFHELNQPAVRAEAVAEIEPSREVAIQRKEKDKKRTFSKKLRCRELGISEWPQKKFLRLEDNLEICTPLPYQYNHSITENSLWDYQYEECTLAPVDEASRSSSDEHIRNFGQEFDSIWNFKDEVPEVKEINEVATEEIIEEASNPVITIGDKKSTSEKSWSIERISKFFHLPAVQAARELYIGKDKLKKICTELGINQWPHRKLQYMDRLLSKFKKDSDQGEKVIELEHKSEQMLANPNNELKTQSLGESSSKKKRYQQLINLAHSTSFANSSRVPWEDEMF